MRADTEVGALITSGELAAMSGLELCWETRVLAGRDRPIYVILMSSSIDKSKLGEALDSGADDFISKPPVPTSSTRGCAPPSGSARCSANSCGSPRSIR